MSGRAALSDDHLAAIAWADPREPTAALARRIAAPYFTVYKARRRASGPFGWHCPLVLATCAECGQPLLRSRTFQRTTHASCARSRLNRHKREQRAHGLIPPSTPYVAAWRRRNPERAAELKRRALARVNALWPTLPPEARAASLAALHAADARDQPLTAERATATGTTWTEEEDRMVLARMDDPAREVALALGRTLYAVRHRRVTLRRVDDYRRREPATSARPARAVP